MHLLIGSDSLADIPGWKNPGVIYDNTTIVSMTRPGYSVERISEDAAIILLTSGRNAISSSEIRRLVSKGDSVRYLVPREVELFIKRNSLYKHGR